jgi:DNA-binding TFAR19-related protein (PDSD5 family)
MNGVVANIAVVKPDKAEKLEMILIQVSKTMIHHLKLNL